MGTRMISTLMRMDFCCKHFNLNLEFHQDGQLKGKFFCLFLDLVYEFNGFFNQPTEDETEIAFFMEWELHGALSGYLTSFSGKIKSDIDGTPILTLIWLLVHDESSFSSAGNSKMKMSNGALKRTNPIHTADQSILPYPKLLLASLFNS